jgi:hypothetical protein
VQTDYRGILESGVQNLPFGEPVGSSAGATEKNFTSKEIDTESGNDYFGGKILRELYGPIYVPRPCCVISFESKLSSDLESVLLRCKQWPGFVCTITMLETGSNPSTITAVQVNARIGEVTGKRAPHSRVGGIRGHRFDLDQVRQSFQQLSLGLWNL